MAVQAPGRWDAALIGAGLSSLSLAWRLAEDPGTSILLIDGRRGDEDRTFAWWSRTAGPFDALAWRTWETLDVRVGGADIPLALGSWRYRALRARDLRRVVLARLAQRPNARVLRGRAEAVEDGPDGVTVVVDGQAHRARFAFDSRFDLGTPPPTPGRVSLVQSFQGWWVEADDPAFDPARATLMDFDVPQGQGVGFTYLLPETPTRALAMAVRMGPDVDPPPLAPWLDARVGPGRWRVTATEGGATPMTDAPFRRRLCDHVLSIGITGGRLRASTGYAFGRIQRDSDRIADSLARRGHPFDLPADPWRVRMADAVFLRLLADQPQRMGPVFARLFTEVPTDVVLRFLDEGGGWMDLLRVMWAVPNRPFLAAAARVVRARLLSR
ncbi:MAG: hypothetical protein H6739_12055 [Alphaproteobacteria bacterium]|nr:hypothetical protein [Alphaproteobacteria bacterium]